MLADLKGEGVATASEKQATVAKANTQSRKPQDTEENQRDSLYNLAVGIPKDVLFQA
jgi:hypothetical protein